MSFRSDRNSEFSTPLQKIKNLVLFPCNARVGNVELTQALGVFRRQHPYIGTQLPDRSLLVRAPFATGEDRPPGWGKRAEARSEERRVGKEGRWRRAREQTIKKRR